MPWPLSPPPFPAGRLPFWPPDDPLGDTASLAPADLAGGSGEPLDADVVGRLEDLQRHGTAVTRPQLLTLLRGLWPADGTCAEIARRIESLFQWRRAPPSRAGIALPGYTPRGQDHAFEDDRMMECRRWDPEGHDPAVQEVIGRVRRAAQAIGEKAAEAVEGRLRDIEADHRRLRVLWRSAVPEERLPVSALDEEHRRALRHLLDLLEREGGEGTPDATERIAAAVAGGESHHVRHLRTLLRLLPKDGKGIDVRVLGSARMRGLLSKSDLFGPRCVRRLLEMVRLVSEQFPEGDGEDFLFRFLRDPSARLFFSECGEPPESELLAFFGIEEIADGRFHADWLTALQDAPVRGLAEATLRSGLRDAWMPRGYLHAATPTSRTMQFLERTCVTYGTSDPAIDPYRKRRYLLSRTLPEERHLYLAKRLSDAELEQAKRLCEQSDRLYPFPVRGTTLQIARLQFGLQKDPWAEAMGGSESWLLDFMHEQGNGLVISRYLSGSDAGTMSRQRTFYAIFEPSRLSASAFEGLTQDRRTLRERHERLRAGMPPATPARRSPDAAQ